MNTNPDVQTKPLLQALNGKVPDRVPVWLMRQAGRYLPEYRELRANTGSFLDLCYSPELAAEVTLQPLRRYGMDGAILFSDILVIPHALGQPLDYVEGEGPKLDPIRDAAAVAKLSANGLNDVLGPIYETVRRVRADLPEGAALIGFAGSPWTVACYMVEGGGSRDFAEVRRFAYGDPDGFGQLIVYLVDSTIVYLRHQIDAGAEAVQLFDTWAGILPESAFQSWVVAPTARIVEAIRATHPATPIIGFPRGAGLMYQDYAKATAVSVLALDTSVPLASAKALQETLPVQGNLDPVTVMVGGEEMRRSAKDILQALAGGPFVFNLGHGVLQHTPPDHVGELIALIREGV